jgi:hypothetical protein
LRARARDSAPVMTSSHTHSCCWTSSRQCLRSPVSSARATWRWLTRPAIAFPHRRLCSRLVSYFRPTPATSRCLRDRIRATSARCSVTPTSPIRTCSRFTLWIRPIGRQLCCTSATSISRASGARASLLIRACSIGTSSRSKTLSCDHRYECLSVRARVCWSMFALALTHLAPRPQWQKAFEDPTKKRWQYESFELYRPFLPAF